MTTGVLIYCFDTPEVNYHLLAERCVAQIRKYLKLEITIVTNLETFKKFKPLGMINYKIVDNKTGSIIIFPSYMEHRIKPVTKGTRYSLVIWFLGPPFV